MRPAPRSRLVLASRLLAALGDEFLGETALPGLPKARTYPAFHGLRFLDDEVVVLDPSHECLAGLESERLANRSRNHYSPLDPELDIGMQSGKCHLSYFRVIK